MKKVWRSWRQWRKGRPFWGGLLVVLAGAEICSLPLAPLEVMLHQGVAGISSVLMGLIIVLMGLSLWFAPQYRSLAGIVTVMLAAACLVLSNLGGFFVGTLSAIVGGSLGFAWQPRPHEDDGAPAGERAGGGGHTPGSAPPSPDEPPHHTFTAAEPGH